MQFGAGQGGGTDVLSLWYDICLQLIYGNRTQTDQSTVITSFYSVVSVSLHWFEGQDQMQWVITKNRIFMIAYYLGKL